MSLTELLKQSNIPIKDNIVVLKNVFSTEIHKKIYNNLISSQEWGFLQKSNVGTSDITFWITILGGYLKKANKLIYNPFYEKELFYKIISLIKPFLKSKYGEQEIQIVPLEIYANGQTKGQTGNWHKDSEEENAWTFLYYVNPEWDITKWDGQTSYADSIDNIFINNYKPNSGVLFKSNIWHFGRDPSIYFNGLRITLAYKLMVYKKGTLDYEKFLDGKKQKYIESKLSELKNIENNME